MVGTTTPSATPTTGMQAGPGHRPCDAWPARSRCPRASPTRSTRRVQAVSTTELTVAGPDGELNMSVNVHVDGFLDTPVCGSATCGGLGVEFGRAVRSPVGAQHSRRDAGQQPRARLRSGPGRVPRARRRDRDSVRRADEHSDPDHDRPQRGRPLRRRPGPVDVRRGFRRPRREAPGELRPGEAGAERHPGRLHRVGAERRRQPLD